MKTRAAVLHESPGRWSVETVELDEPKSGEVLVKMAAAGLCHSDYHYNTADYRFAHYPFVGGHEGGGVVAALGPEVQGLEVGDHVLMSFVSACGMCRWCAMGKGNLCDLGAEMMKGPQLDGTFRLHTEDGKGVGTSGMLGTFAEHQVFDQRSLVKVDKDIPLDVASLVSCGVQTGLGSAVDAGNVRPGDVVLIVGVGGVGMNAVQGAQLAGAGHVIVADPSPWKQKAALDFGATESFDSIASARGRIGELTNGQGADVAVLTASLVSNQLIGEGYEAIRKAGTLVVTGVCPDTENGVIPGVNATMLLRFEKRIVGSLYGSSSPREAMPKLLGLYRSGRLKLDELITRTYTLDQINEGFEDMMGGENIRGVIRFDD